MFFHEAIVKILEENDRMMTTTEIANAVNDTKYYTRKDGSMVTPFQIHGRTKNYPQLFTRDGSRVGLKKWENKRK